jgi:hypothetical protein
LDQWQVAERVENDEVAAEQLIGKAAGPATLLSASSLLTRSTALKKRPRDLASVCCLRLGDISARLSPARCKRPSSEKWMMQWR